MEFFKGLKRDSSADSRLTEQYQVNDRVFLSKNRQGIVKYVGPTLLGSGKIMKEIEISILFLGIF